jgi:centrin-1
MHPPYLPPTPFPHVIFLPPSAPLGKIDPKELKAAMQSLGFEAKNATVYSMIRDLSGEDQVDFDTFLDMLTAKVGDTDSREDINKVFNLFDVDGKGRITLRDLKRVAKELGESMSDAELLEMVERADRDGDSEITQDDFFLIMTRKVRGLQRAFARFLTGRNLTLPPPHKPHTHACAGNLCIEPWVNKINRVIQIN